MKNNTPECVLLSPEAYMKLVDEANDARLALLAADRLRTADLGSAVSVEKVMKELKITEKNLESGDEVELE